LRPSDKTLMAAVFLSCVMTAVSASADAEVLPPKKQVDQGVAPEDVVCRDGMSLAVRGSGMPACVTPSTAERLEQRGWNIIGPEHAGGASEPAGAGQAQNETETAGHAGALPAPAPARQAPPEIGMIPASPGSVVNFYVVDDDLNLSPRAADIVSTEGLLEVTVNGTPIGVPDRMTEVGFDTGRFLIQLSLPDAVDGRPLQHGDLVLIRYLDETGDSGEPGTTTKSFTLSSSYARVDAGGTGTSRIGHEFTFRIYEPDANTDSRDEDKIPLSRFEYRGEGGIRTTLANPDFDANSAFMIETGPDTGTFEVKIRIPRELDGRIVHIGDWYEIRYIDITTPSGTHEEIVFEGRIG